MSVFELDGLWEGEYTYTPAERAPLAGPSVAFTLHARAGWFGSFRGVIEDDPHQGSPVPATVRGGVAGLSLRFTKVYRELVLVHGGRCMTLREYLATERGMDWDLAARSHPIVYEGIYEPHSQCARGAWRIEPQQVRFVNLGQTVSVKIPGGEGRWVMGRA